MAKPNSRFMSEFSTAAKYAVQNWPRMTALIKKYGAAPKDSPTDLLPTVVLQDVFNGGFSFCFREWTAMLTKIEQVLVLLRDWKESPAALTPDAVKQFHCEGVEITKVALAKVEKLRKKLLSDMKKQDKLLQELYAQACELVQKQLAGQGVVLNPQQQKMLNSISTRRALHHHLTQAKQTSFAPIAVLSFSDYFKHKTRMVLASSPVNAEAQVQKLSGCFQSIEKLAEQWVARHIQPMQKQLQDALRAEELV